MYLICENVYVVDVVGVGGPKFIIFDSVRSFLFLVFVLLVPVSRGRAVMFMPRYISPPGGTSTEEIWSTWGANQPKSGLFLFTRSVGCDQMIVADYERQANVVACSVWAARAMGSSKYIPPVAAYITLILSESVLAIPRARLDSLVASAAYFIDARACCRSAVAVVYAFFSPRIS